MNSITPIFKEQYNYDFYNHKRLNKFSMVEGQSSLILVGKKGQNCGDILDGVSRSHSRWYFTL